MKKLLYLTTAALLLPLFLLAQGSLSGTLLDEKTGETLIGANIVIEGTTIGASSDFDGKYQFETDPGIYTVVVSYIGYNDKKISEVEIKDGEVTYLDVALSDEAIELDLEVVVTAKVIERSENAILMLQKKSDKIQDGISSQEMARFSVSDAAGAMKKVTGATVSGGKYIYIRGLGDRYSLSQLNGLIIPSTDPYRNSAQLDLIPSNLLDNIITAKTFTPDQPGTFTGGNVNIKTKSFPEQFSLTVSLSTAFNAQNNLTDNFLTHEGGDSDYWGYDDGTRDRPAILDDPKVQSVLDLRTQTPLIARLDIDGRGEEVGTTADQIIKSFNNDFTEKTMSTPIDHGLSLAFGNQYSLFGKPLGVILSASTKHSYLHLDRFQKANWRLEDQALGILDNQGDFEETNSTENARVSGLAGLAYKFSNLSSISFTFIYNHNTDKRTRFIFGERPDNILFPEFLTGRNLVFQQRELINFQLGGEHVIERWNNTKFEWKLSRANSSQLEPDTRFFEDQFNEDFGTYTLPASNIQRPFHFFRDLEDEQTDVKVDLTIPFSENKANKLKFGSYITRKDRDFREWRYQVEEHTGFGEQYAGDPDAYLADSNIGLIDVTDNGRYILSNYIVDATEARNNYVGSEDVTAFYGMLTLGLSPRLKFIGGARYEQTDIFVESQDMNRDPGSIDEGDILPSVNFIYSLGSDENMNLRASYSKTLARPNMREIAPFESFDPLTKEIYLGNTDLQRSRIDNFDLRWEWFINPGELLAVSGYYKTFDDPIILFYRRAPNPEIQFTNVDGAELYGIELEFRKDLASLAPFLKNFKFNTNFSIIESSSDVVDLTGLEPTDRPFEGQPTFILNAALVYTDIDRGVDAVLALNTLGDRLNIIGREGTPDIFDRGRSQLDFSFIKKLGNVDVKLTAQNLLDHRFLISSDYLGTEYVYSRFQRGITFGLGISYTVR